MERIAITIDVEQDCPPFLETMRGIEEGLPRLMELFRNKEIKTTFFTTGKVAELYPEAIVQITEDGHELGCHGYVHERFDRVNKEQAGIAIAKAKEILEDISPSIVSFRAPNLQFPPEYMEILQGNGFKIDSSIAKYKPPFPGKSYMIGDITRIPASITSSFLRLPLPMILPILDNMHDPVLFVHPWEFVDMSHSPIRWDCKFNTGKFALKNLSAVILHFKTKGYNFLTMSEMAAENGT
jgi:peptidoglycan/xylan/chitin deacetylase (PgdA/CDA1 family)